MHKNYKQALLLLRDTKSVIENLDFLWDEAEALLDEINTLLTHEQEHDESFATLLQEKYNTDYLAFEKDTPLSFDEWLFALDTTDTDTRYNYFISFLQS